MSDPVHGERVLLRREVRDLEAEVERLAREWAEADRNWCVAKAEVERLRKLVVTSYVQGWCDALAASGEQAKGEA